AVGLAAGSAQAADFPTKPIQIAVPIKPGGGSAVSAPVFAKHLSKYLPVKVIITNIAGARGRMGELEVKRARADGYMVLWQHQNLHMAYATGRSKYDYTAFKPLADTVRTDNALIVRKGTPYKTPTELNAAAKAAPGTIRWGAAINGISHFAYLAYLDAINMNEETFHTIGMSGDKDRIIAMMQGNLDVAVVALSSARPYLESGDIRLLGTMSEARSDAYPDLPTLKEQGVDCAFYFDYMSFVPAGTPEDHVKILKDAWIKAAADPETKKDLSSGWMIPMLISGPEFDTYLAKQLKQFTQLANKYGLAKETGK
ncbi:MAG: tripartite tricarboxylate transporter substrate binding protein, partial [Rhodospirillaceae bacterium]|nr:tripartite tricarboxylate transporter substrate binding protein [Rhodospirillaceae bacterium]